MIRLRTPLLLICALIASSHAWAKIHGGVRDSNTLTERRTEYPLFVQDLQLAPPGEILFLAERENDGKGRKKDWDELSDKQKKRIQKRRKEFDALPPQEQERIRSAREKYRQLPDKRRDELRRKWRKMTPEERARYRHLNDQD